MEDAYKRKAHQIVFLEFSISLCILFIYLYLVAFMESDQVDASRQSVVTSADSDSMPLRALRVLMEIPSRWSILRDIVFLANESPYSPFHQNLKERILVRLFRIGRFEVLDEIAKRAGWMTNMDEYVSAHVPNIKLFEEKLTPRSSVAILYHVVKRVYQHDSGLEVTVHHLLAVIESPFQGREMVIYVIPAEDYEGDFWVVRSGLSYHLYPNRDYKDLAIYADLAKSHTFSELDLCNIWQDHIQGKFFM